MYDVLNHSAFAAGVCTAAVQEGCADLKHLDIKYTPAATAYADGDWELNFSRLEVYMATLD